MYINHLNDISRVYLEQVAEASVKERAAKAVDHQRKGTHGDDDELEQLQGDAQKSIDKLKNRRVTRASASLAARRVEGDVKKSNKYGPQRPKPGTVTGRRIEEPKPTGSKPKGYRTEEIGIDEAKKGDGNLANNYPPYDKVTRGDVIAGATGNDEMGGKKKKKVEEGNDGNLANNYPPYDKVTRGDVIAGRLGNDEMGGKKKKKDKKLREGFSNWRQDLSEVMTDTEDNQKITDKKIKNKIKTSAMGGGIKLGEAVENLGGQLIEMTQIDGILDEFTDYEINLLSDTLIEKVVEEVFYTCIEEGYEIDEIEEYICE
jgi:hypothetical protein